MRLNILPIVLLAAACARGDEMRFFSPKLTHDNRRFCSILVLPAQFTVTKFSIRGSEGLSEEGDRFEDEFSDAIAKLLAGHGAPVLQVRAPDQLSVGGRAELAAMQRSFDAVDAVMQRASAGVRKGRFTLGDSVAGYTPAASADTLVFIRGAGQVPADKAGSQLGYLIGKVKLEVRVAFVDARTGYVLAWGELTCHTPSADKFAGAMRTYIDKMMSGQDGEPPALYDFIGAGLKPGACPAK